MDTTTEAFESFQIPLEAAEFYESAFVPAFFAQWAPVLCEAAGIESGQSVLDVARRVRPGIDFRQGRADNLPFPDESFNTVLCQMALMFFPDRGKALAEMARVVADGGTVAVVVPGVLDSQAAFAPFVAMAARHAGPEAKPTPRP